MNKSQIKKILVVAPNWIGDAVLAIPAISVIREYFPHSKISVIAIPHVGELFKESPFFDEIKRFSSTSTPSNNKGGLMSEALKLRQDNFDLAILFPNSFRSAMLARLAGIPLRCGYKKDGRGFLLNIPVKLNNQLKKVHQTEYYLNISNTIQDFFPSSTIKQNKIISQAKCLTYNNSIKQDNLTNQSPSLTNNNSAKQYTLIGQASCLTFEKIQSPSTRLFISKDEANHALETLSKYNITPDDLIIGINPGAAYGSSKRWYPERFGQVAKTLIKGYNVKVVVFGSHSEIKIAEEIRQNAEVDILNLAGKTSIRELMALISYCKVFITNDSGPMHIASALSVPVVAIFGSTDPSITGPKGTENTIIKKNIECSPCFLRECPKKLECMDMISVDDVVKGVEKILK